MTERLMVIRGAGGPAPARFCPALHDLAKLAVLHIPNTMALDNQAEVNTIRRYGDHVPVGDSGQIVTRALEYASSHRVDAIVTFSEPLIAETAEVAARLGLRYHSPEVARRLRDKTAQRTALAERDVPSAAFWRIEAPEDLGEALEHVPLPSVLKPVSGFGSMLTFRIDSAEDLGHAYLTAREMYAPTVYARECLPPFQLEEMLIGTDWHGDDRWGDYVSVESLVIGGEIAHLHVSDRTPLAPPFRETGLIMPSSLSDEQQQQVLDVAEGAIEAVGATDGATHIELKLTAGGPRIIEVNGRPGSPMPDLYAEVSDFDIVREVGKISLGQAPRSTVEFEAYAGFMIPPAPMGERHAVDVHGLEQARQIPGVRRVLRYEVSDHDWRRGASEAMVSGIGVADTPDEMLEVQRRFFETIDFELAPDA